MGKVFVVKGKLEKGKLKDVEIVGEFSKAGEGREAISNGKMGEGILSVLTLHETSEIKFQKVEKAVAVNSQTFGAKRGPRKKKDAGGDSAAPEGKNGAAQPSA